MSRLKHILLRHVLPLAISGTALVYVFGFAIDWQSIPEATERANMPLFIAITVFDNLELCERSNQCDAIYPSCTAAMLDYTLLIDYSGPMVGLRDGYDAHLESRQQAARTVTISI